MNPKSERARYARQNIAESSGVWFTYPYNGTKPITQNASNTICSGLWGMKKENAKIAIVM